MTILIREADIKDSKQIVPLMDLLKIPQSCQTISNAILKYQNDKNYKFFVAEENEEILGLITLYTYSLYLIPCKKCYIETLVVSAQHQKKNIGKKLLQKAEEYALNIDCEFIELISANWRNEHGVHKFYIKNGYINDGEKGISYFYKTFKNLWSKV